MVSKGSLARSPLSVVHTWPTYRLMLLYFGFVSLHVYVLRGQFDVCVTDYIHAAVSFSSEQFRNKMAVGSDSNVKHHGR